MEEIDVDKLKLESYPDCHCGKCPIRRERKGNFTNNLPYSKNLSSSYDADFPWKTRPKDFQYYNRSMHTGNENSYKENLPNAKESLMKSSFRSYKIVPEKANKDNVEVLQQPFLGHTTNEEMLPNWGSIQGEPKQKLEYKFLHIPMRGISTNMEMFPRYPPEAYKTRDPLCFGKDTLRFAGVMPQTSLSHADFKPIDLHQPEYFGMDKYTTKSLAFLQPEISKEYSQSTYKADYQPYDDSNCELKPVLNKKGTRYLKI